MAQTSSSGRFPELFELIADYASRDHAHQEKALRLINVAYDEGPPEAEGMPDARQAVDDILNGNDYVFPTSGLGALDPRSVDAVVRVALYEEGNRDWGIDPLCRMLQGWSAGWTPRGATTLTRRTPTSSWRGFGWW